MNLSLHLFKSKLLLRLLAIRVFGTFFAFYIYSRLTTLGDAERYLSAQLDFNPQNLVNRTSFTDLFYALLGSIFPDIIATLIPSLILGFVTYYVFHKSYRCTNKSLFWACMLLPHFVIWSSVAGKEVIAITAFMIVIKSCVDKLVFNKINIPQVAIALVVGLLMRPHYFIPYFILFIGTIVKQDNKLKVAKISQGVSGTLLATVFAVFLAMLAASYGVWINFLNTVMTLSEAYFLSYDADSNRLGIAWSNLSDFLGNIWWGIPTSIVGPTLSESLSKIIFIPIFIEGIISFLLIFYLLKLILRLSDRESKYRPVIIFGFIPAVIVALVFHYPFGLFNPGSAIRYKQSLAPLFYFYPLLLIAEVKRLKAFSTIKISEPLTKISTQLYIR